MQRMTVAQQVEYVKTKSKIYQDGVNIGLQTAGKKGFKKIAEAVILKDSTDLYDGFCHGIRLKVQVLEELPQMTRKEAI